MTQTHASPHFSAPVLMALLAALLFGASTPLAKMLLSDISPWLLAGLLYLGSGLGLTLLALLRRLVGHKTDAQAERLATADLPWLAGAILAGGVAAPVLLMIGLAGVSGAAASLLLNAEGVFTALLAWFAFRENFDRRIALGMLAIVAGAVLLSWTPGELSWRDALSPLAILGACLCWGIDNNLTRKVSLSDPVRIAASKGLAAGLVNLTLALVLGIGALPTPTLLVQAGLVGFFGYGLSLVLFVMALRGLGSARAGAYFSAAPFVGAALSIPLLGEQPTLRLLAAGGLMAFGLWLHLTERHDHAHDHGETDHAHSHRHDDPHHQHSHAPGEEPVPPDAAHVHWHRHAPLRHSHPHYPDSHHRHAH